MKSLQASLSLLALSALFIHAHAQAPAGPPPGGPGMGAPPAGAEQEEANPPVIDSFKYEGNAKLATAQLMKDTTMKTGAKITRALVGGEIQRLVALYKLAGHEVAISPDIQHPADGHVTVTFKINEAGKGGDAGAAPAR